jgi:undecaprenol kinase
MRKDKSSLTEKINSYRNAINGIIVAVRSELHLKFHLVSAIIAVTAGIYFQISRIEWGLVAIAIGGVIIAELFNTAMELLCDYLTLEHDERIGVVKDIAAGAVLISSITAIIIGVIVFIPLIYSS